MTAELTPRDQVLHWMAREGWSNDSCGEVQADAGQFWRVSNDEAELPEVIDAFAERIAEAGLSNVAQLIGHFLVTERLGGNVTVCQFERQDDLVSVFHDKCEQFDRQMDEVEL